MDAAGNVYIADAGNFRVRMVAANGNISTFAGSGVRVRRRWRNRRGRYFYLPAALR